MMGRIRDREILSRTAISERDTTYIEQILRKYRFCSNGRGRGVDYYLGLFLRAGGFLFLRHVPLQLRNCIFCRLSDSLQVQQWFATLEVDADTNLTRLEFLALNFFFLFPFTVFLG